MSHSSSYITFHNNTDVPIMIDSWKDNSPSLHSHVVKTKDKVFIHSSVDEWHLHSMFPNADDRKKWVERGWGKELYIGKFRSEPCIQGQYSWLESDKIFECIYSEESDKTILVTLSEKKNPKDK
jgi:hypothetical protein